MPQLSYQKSVLNPIQSQLLVAFMLLKPQFFFFFQKYKSPINSHGEISHFSWRSHRGSTASAPGGLWDRSLQRPLRCPESCAELHAARATPAELHAAAAAGAGRWWNVGHRGKPGSISELGWNLSIKKWLELVVSGEFSKFKLAKLWVYSLKTSGLLWRYVVSYPVVNRELPQPWAL